MTDDLERLRRFRDDVPNSTDAARVAARRRLAAAIDVERRGRTRARRPVRQRSPRLLAIGLAALTVTGAVAYGASQVVVHVASTGRNGVVYPPRGSQAVAIGCATTVFSPGQTWPNHWPRPLVNTIVAGPIAWPGILALATDAAGRGGPPATTYAPRHGLAFAQDNLAAVTDGAVVTLSIPADERQRLSLDYTYIPPRADGRFQVADGASQVTFRGCSPGSNDAPSSLFEGGFIVAGAQCAQIDVYVRPTSRPLVRRIPFGVPRRSCRPGG
ncbi:MAG TPA: hypothetical protein VIJ51_10740 [Solirubrobacteraceae bacterium]